MFESLSDRLSGIFDKLRGRGALSEDDVRSAMREVRVALLEADVALPVARDFVDKVTERVMSRLYLTRIPCIFEVLDRLYWDPARGRQRRGITPTDVRPGDLNHRFPLGIRQLEMTYDLMSLTADQLISGARQTSCANTTSSAVNGSPSCQVTPGWM